VESSANKEQTMNAMQVMIALTFLRVVMPVGALLLIGEWANRKSSQFPGAR